MGNVAGGHHGFDPVFDLVVELVSARAEELDAVVGHRIVRRRDHHTERRVVVAGQEGDGGRRQHADADGVGADRGESGADRGF